MWPQYMCLALFMVGLGFGLAQHGKERAPHNFVTDLISTALVIFLLSMGGFFRGM